MSKKSIGQVGKVLNLPVHTVRFWTENFEHIQKLCTIGNGGRRYYNEKAIAELEKVKEMLYNKGMTIDGVKRLVKYNKINTTDLDVIAVDVAGGDAFAASDRSFLDERVKNVLTGVEKIRKILNS
ncbi:MAG: hypothetical protein RL208_342 [Pseudomonadota bacterium]|jgi:DNA-binding transcriptional MerR regulator